jgi:hypothetical protein
VTRARVVGPYGVHWFRRDLRLHDNAGLYHALKSNNPVLPIFIFDRNILDELEDHMAEDAAEETLRAVVSWARFGELFSYDDDAALFSLENPT